LIVAIAEDSKIYLTFQEDCKILCEGVKNRNNQNNCNGLIDDGSVDYAGIDSLLGFINQNSLVGFGLNGLIGPNNIFDSGINSLIGQISLISLCFIGLCLVDIIGLVCLIRLISHISLVGLAGFSGINGLAGLVAASVSSASLTCWPHQIIGSLASLASSVSLASTSWACLPHWPQLPCQIFG
jgi:hypothetical protein